MPLHRQVYVRCTCACIIYSECSKIWLSVYNYRVLRSRTRLLPVFLGTTIPTLVLVSRPIAKRNAATVLCAMARSLKDRQAVMETLQFFCEGRHQRWAHASCAGLCDDLYKAMSNSSEPWFYQLCMDNTKCDRAPLKMRM